MILNLSNSVWLWTALANEDEAEAPAHGRRAATDPQANLPSGCSIVGLLRVPPPNGSVFIGNKGILFC